MSNRKTTPPTQSSASNTEAGTNVWRSLGELEKTPDFQNALEREFVDGAAIMETEEDREISRRSFVKLMGASSALAGLSLSACRRPESLIAPYTDAPEWSIPGKPLYYASSMPSASGAVPLVVTTHENRPTKLEPNKRYDDFAGTDAFVQASVLDMYDPARSRDFLKKGEKASRAEFEKMISTLPAESKVGFVFGEDKSPTRNRLVKELQSKFSGAKFYSYEPLTGEACKQVNEEYFGSGADVLADFSEAKVILSLDSDFLELDQHGPVGGFYKNRFVEGVNYDKKASADNLNRLYIVEANYSLTGGMADHRLRIAPSQVVAVAAEIAKILGADVEYKGGKLSAYQKKWAKECANDLKAHSGKNIVVANKRQSKDLHQITVAINTALKNYGKTLKPVVTERAEYGNIDDLSADLQDKKLDTLFLLTPANPYYEVDGFAKAATHAQVVHLGCCKNASANGADWHVPAAHYLESWHDARTAKGIYTVVQPMILPLYNGVSELDLISAVLTGELFDSSEDGGSGSPAFAAVRKTFSGIADDSQKSWMAVLRDGFWKKSTYAKATSKPLKPISVKVPEAPSLDKLEVIFATDGSVYDGRYSNNSWLQEAPDPISKLTWDNAAMVSPKTAKNMGLYEKILELQPKNTVYGIKNVENAGVGPDGEGVHHTNPLIKLNVNGRELEVAVMIGFGLAENIISLSLGYGQGFDEHDALGRGPKNEADVSLVSVNRGFNAYSLRTSKTPYLAFGASIDDLDQRYPTAVTQEHQAMYGRALAREISTIPTVGGHGHGKSKNFDEQIKNVQKQGMDSHAPKNISLYKPKGSPRWNNGKAMADKFLYDKRQQWAMAIDLNVCTGCNACLIACQAENNIPVVGKDQVARGRAMYWVRMDRYFAAVQETDVDGNLVTEKDDHGHEIPVMNEDNPEMIPQPVSCVQCESAPCETVCPVNATVHSEDGLNAMAYNRCIGTRYCANNCPYKARRFNFFDYNKRNPLIDKNLYKGPAGKEMVGEAPSLQRNPNVTVRMRGVMEKCTYCVQRLQMAKAEVKARLKKKVLDLGLPSSEVKITDSEMRPNTDSVQVACEDACSAKAVTFGNLMDPKSKIRRIKNENNELITGRAYDLLNYIGTRPRTSYLARVKNPNPEMPDAKAVGRVTVNMH